MKRSLAIADTIIMESTGSAAVRPDPSRFYRDSTSSSLPHQIGLVCQLKGYLPIEELGQGAFSYVWKVQETEGKYAGRTGALKVLRQVQHENSPGLQLSDEAELQQQIYRSVREQFGESLVPEVYDFEQNQDHSGYILMPAYDATACLASAEIPYGIELLTTIRNVARVHQVIHAANKHNGDLKRRNVFRGGVVGDFGSCGDSYSLREGIREMTIACTLGYASPEQMSLVDSADSRKTDVFSLGVMTYMFASDRQPFGGKSVREYVNQLRTERVTPLEELNIGVPKVFSDLVQSMINFNPEERPNMDDSANRLEGILVEELRSRFSRENQIQEYN